MNLGSVILILENWDFKDLFIFFGGEREFKSL